MTQNGETLEDLRVRRTRKLLQEATIALSAEKGFAAVTVRDITERAMVNRSTFYRHYLDKYDLLEQYMEEVYALVPEDDFIAEKLGLRPKDAPSGLFCILTHVQEFKEFYRVMLGEKGDMGFRERFRQTTEKRFRVLLDHTSHTPQPDAPPNDLTLRYISCAGVAAITWWLESDHPYSVPQMAQWLTRLMTSNVQPLLE